MRLNSQQREIIKRCQASAIWFMRNFIRIKHPGAGIIPFDPFGYQREAVRAYRTHRFNIHRKCRQAGISKISGVFGLWFGMFAAHKTILIVSRTDEDAKNFLYENVKLPFRNLPLWMQEMWLPRGSKDNEHSLDFSNGTKIRSLTSHPDVLRSNASSLNIIDEAGFIQDMDTMWAGGRPTLQHGGSVIVISTTNGVGNWYWNAWTDAEAGLNDFHPIFVHWWDMTWRIEYTDQLSGLRMVLAPTEDITETAKGKVVQHPEFGRVELSPERYGPYWSPWLEREWRSLQAKGEGWKFDQEILADFVGSGNTVLSKSVLVHIGTTISDQYQRVSGPQTYVHPVTGVEEDLDFTPAEPDEGLWVWRPPVMAVPDRYVGQRLVESGKPAHTYVMGVDTSTGKGRDYQAIEVFDIDEREQVAELMFHCLPFIFIKMIDRIGRWYNCALAVVERNNGGDDLIDDLQREFMYPRLWRRTTVNDRPSAKPKQGPAVTYAHYGHFTSHASKPILNKYLLDYVRDVEDAGFRIYSRRLLKQLQIYVRKKDRAGRDTGRTEAESGPGNFDDLVMAGALALLGAPDSVMPGGAAALPIASSQVAWLPNNQQRLKQLEQKFNDYAGQCLMPMALGAPEQPDLAALAELMRFSNDLVTKPKEALPIVKQRRHQF
jgi:hypothetical protein